MNKALNEMPDPDETTGEMHYLLAVDAGVKTGLALFGKPCNLVWYRSHNMGSYHALKSAIHTILQQIQGLRYLVVEGGGPIALQWTRQAEKQGISCITTDAGEWRKELLYSREYRNAETAKQTAVNLAGNLISRSGVKGKNTPTHDAAEAILAGIWGCKKTGWIADFPELRK